MDTVDRRDTIMPPSNGFAVTPDDANDLPFVTTALNVSQTGTVRVTTLNNDTIDLSIAAGIAFPCRVRRVHASGTAAGNIVGLY